MTEYIPILTTVIFFTLIYISSIIYASEFNINIMSSRCILISLAYLSILASWSFRIPLSTGLLVYALLVSLYIILRLNYIDSVIEFIKSIPILIYPFLVFTYFLVFDSVLIHYDEGYHGQVAKSLWLGFPGEDDVKYYLLKSFLWSALNSFSDIFDYSIGVVIEWSIFLLLVVPLFKRTGNHIVLVLILILFFSPQTYFTSSYSDGSNAIFLTLVFFTSLGFLSGKNNWHELIGPLFLLSISKSDSIYTITVFFIAIISVFILSYILRYSKVHQFQVRSIVAFLLGFILIIFFTLLVKDTFPTTAENYRIQFINKALEQKNTSEGKQIGKDSLEQKNTSEGKQIGKDSLVGLKVIPMVKHAPVEIGKTVDIGNTVARTVAQVSAGDVFNNFLMKIQKSLWALLPNFENLYSFSIFIPIWLIYKYRKFTKEEKVAAQLFFILYVGIFLYINLAYVLFFSKTETDLVHIPSFMRYLCRTMLIPMVLVYSFYNVRYDLSKFLNDIRVWFLYLLVLPLASYTQIWRI